MALGLGLVMALSVVACGGGTDEKGQADGSGQGSGMAEEGEAGADREPITLTFGVPYSDYGNGIHTDKNLFLQRLKEVTGVELEFVIYDADSYALMCAGGDLTDIILLTTNTPGSVEALIASGGILPLDDLLDEYGQHIKANIPDALEAVRDKENGDKIYGLPTNVSDAGSIPRRNADIGFRARYDIYKQIGSPEIRSQDDFLNVLKAMQDYERERTGENDIYCFGSFTDWGTWPYYICYPFMYGLMDTKTGFSYDRVTGELVNNYTDGDSVYWDGMAFFNRAYQMGLFDPDGLMQKVAQYDDKVATGKYIATIYSPGPLDPSLLGEEAVMTYLPGTAFPNVNETYAMAYPAGYQMEASRAISASCPYPERAMQVLDYIDSPEGSRFLLNGVQGEDWDVVDGVPQLIGSMMDAYRNGTQNEYRRDRTGDALCKGCMSSGNIVLDDGYPVDLTTGAEFISQTVNAAERAFAQDFGSDLSYPGQVYEKWIEEGTVTDITTAEGALKVASLGNLSEEASLISAEAEDYLASNIAKLIFASSDEEFQKEKDSMIAKFRELGFDMVEEEMIALFDAAHRDYEERVN